MGAPADLMMEITDEDLSPIMTNRAQPLPPFVIAATLAGHLYSMMHTAKLMLLSASNAKGVAARAGDKALGFRPITDFIAEMANDTILYATKINQLALTVSRTSVTSMRAQDGARRFIEARQQLSGADKTGMIDHLVQASTEAQSAMQTEISDIMSQLSLQLDEIHQRVRGSTIVVSTSRTEASRAGEFQQYLNSIADSVELAASELQREITECRQLIDVLNSN